MKFKNSYLLLSFFLSLSSFSFSQSTTQVTGCFSGDCLNGAGKYLFSNGDKFSGYWKNGIRDDYGRYDWVDGSWYLGDFKNDSITGTGTFHTIKGDLVSGTWKENKLTEVSNGTSAELIGMALPFLMKKEETTIQK